jgi:hypothetical protein
MSLVSVKSTKVQSLVHRFPIALLDCTSFTQVPMYKGCCAHGFCVHRFPIALLDCTSFTQVPMYKDTDARKKKKRQRYPSSVVVLSLRKIKNILDSKCFCDKDSTFLLRCVQSILIDAAMMVRMIVLAKVHTRYCYRDQRKWRPIG